MNSWGKSSKEEKTKKHPKNPSFSSNLLDEIMRSIDDEKHEQNLNIYKDKSTRKQNYIINGSNTDDDQETVATLTRVYSRRRVASLPKAESTKSHKENDSRMFFSSSSSSSDSSSGNLSVSSDSEVFGPGKGKTSRIHCFSAPRPKQNQHQQPKKSNVPPNPGRFQNPLYSEKSHEYYMFEDYKTDENSNKSSNKSKPMNIYSSLKKMKQPISPGFRLTSFINSLFSSSANGKKTKNGNINRGLSSEDSKSTTNASTCSSASSFTRSCLSKSAPDHDHSRKFINGVKRSVNFYPVSVILDEDSRPCGQKSIYSEEFESFRRPSSSQKSKIVEIKNRKIEDGKRNGDKGYQNQKKNNFLVEKIVRDKIGRYEDVDDDEDEDEDEDAASDSSSDLFEIDHLELFGNEGFSQELPVYETTRLDRNNHAIARGLIC